MSNRECRKEFQDNIASIPSYWLGKVHVSTSRSPPDMNKKCDD